MDNINIKIDESAKNKFKAICAKKGTTMTDELKRYIYKIVNNSEEGIHRERKEAN